MPIQSNKKRRELPKHVGQPVGQAEHPGQDGSKQGGADHSAGQFPSLHFLTDGLRSLSLFEVCMAAGHQIKADMLSMIDTEEKQLQAIEDLYSIVKAQRKYRNLRDPKWTVDTPPITVLTWLLRKLGPLAQGNRWMVDTFREGRKIRFRLVVWKNFFSYNLKQEDVYLALDFLPSLKKRDQPLHDLIIDVIALVSKCNKVPLWDEDGDFSQQLQRIKKEGPTGNTVYDTQLISYTKGPASMYLKRIRQRMNKVTPATVRKACLAYKDTSDRKGYMKHWLKLGVNLASEKKTIEPWAFTPHHVQGNPITPARLYKFIWSAHDNDVIYRRAKDRVRKDAEMGEFYPVIYNATCPGEKVLPIKFEQYAFPTQLWWFMRVGRTLIFHKYSDYFIKALYDDQLTPAEAMLEKIDAIELENFI